MSDEDAEDTADSLDIKPPQATVLHHHHHKSSSRSGGSKRDKHSDSRREHVSSFLIESLIYRLVLW